MTTKRRVCIVGGGASGMIAAIAARRLGADVTILERNPRVGKKILATGNGRCNFTNVNAGAECYSGRNPKFVYSALASFTPEDAIAFFEKLGIAHKVEDQGKVYPMSDQASSILDVLYYELNELKVNIVCNAYVSNISKGKAGFTLTLTDGRVFHADRVILAAGGRAMPSSGSDGNGYELAKKFGHSIVDVFPVLVQLKLEGPYFGQIDGVRFVGTAELLYNSKALARERGDILFGNYGVSGPPVLQLSRKAGQLLQEGREPVLKISVIDTMSKDEVRALIAKRIETAPKKTAMFSLVGLVNKRLIPVLLKEAGIRDLNSPVASLSSGDRNRIADILTDWRFKVRGTKGWQSAQVTAGGVDTSEIEQSTMASRLVKGLYFAGEIIDIDGLCGGFNLQWAWSSGYVAGQSAALLDA